MINNFWWGSRNDANSGINWTRPGNLTFQKEFGGMSFRDLHGFNLAMLEVMTNPSYVLCSIWSS